MSFDPYYEWLGIPPDEQPADYYRLLGVRRFESNLNVIENGAERQLLLLKTRQNGPHSELTQQLMNEVSTARICLLDGQKKSAYDAELKKRTDDGMSTSGSPLRVNSPPLEEPPPLEQLTPADLLPSPRRPYPTSADSPRRLRKKKSRRLVDRGASGTRLPLVVGGAVATGAGLLMLWLFLSHGSSRPTNALVSREHAGSSSITPEHQGGGQTAGERPAREKQTDRPPQPPVRTTPNGDLSESKSVQTGDMQRPAYPEKFPSAGQNALAVKSVPQQGSAQHNIEDSDSVEELDTRQSRPTPEPVPRIVDHVTFEEASTPRQSLSTGLTRVFARLPTEFDLSAAIASSGPESVFVGELLSFRVANWHVALEDYSTPTGAPKFLVGALSTGRGLLEWPLISVTSVGESPRPDRLSSDEALGQTLLGHVQAGPTGLFLKFSRSAHPELIEQFTCCSLTIRQDDEQHRVQLQTPERMPPLTLAFDSPRAELTLEAMPTADAVFPDRIMLEILRVDMGPTEVPTASRLRVKLDKELTVTLDNELQCEIGIRLAGSKGQFGIVVMPRCVINDRRQRLVVAEIEKDLARSRSQFAKRQRDLVEAQGNLRALPGQIRRLNEIRPNTPLQAAQLQVQIGNLQQIGAKAQTTERRLFALLPKLARTGEQMERALAFAKEMSNSLTLHFRVIAQGETGDLVLLQATTTN